MRHLLRRGTIPSLAVLGLSLLSACATAPAYDPGLTPAQNELKQASARFDTTSGASCAVGAGAGNALGFVNSITSGNTPPPPSKDGGTVGTRIGCGAGYLVARSRRSGPDAALVSDEEVQQAQQDVAAYRRAAAAASQIAQDAQGRGSGPTDPRVAANDRASASLMTRDILGMQKVSDALRMDARGQYPGKAEAMADAATQIDAARSLTEHALADLNASLATR